VVKKMPRKGCIAAARRLNNNERQRFIFCFKYQKQKVYFYVNFLFLHLPGADLLFFQK